MQDHFDEGVKLFQWPEAKGVDSIFPRCVIFHRMFNLLDINYEVVNVGLPFMEKKIHEKLRKCLVDLPVLSDHGLIFTNSEQIISHILKRVDNDQQARVNRLVRSQNFVMYQWANEVFLNSLLYARWVKDNNFYNFMKHVNWGNAPKEFYRQGILNLRAQVLKYLGKLPIAKLSEEDFFLYLDSQLNCLNEILQDNQFVIPGNPFISRSDLAVFMVIQGLLSPDLAESEHIKENYPHIIRWAKDLDLKSTGQHTHELILN